MRFKYQIYDSLMMPTLNNTNSPFPDFIVIVILKIVGNKATGVARKQNTSNFPKNKYFLPPDMHTHVCVSGGKKCSFFGKFGVFCFLVTPVLRFALLPYYRRNVNTATNIENMTKTAMSTLS